MKEHKDKVADAEKLRKYTTYAVSVPFVRHARN